MRNTHKILSLWVPDLTLWGTNLSLWGTNLSLWGTNLTLCVNTHEAPLAVRAGLGAPRRGAAFHAAVAAAVAGHDGAAGAATGAVAHLVHGLHRRGRVEDAAVDRVERVGG